MYSYFMMERLKKMPEPEFRSAFGKFCFHLLQWTAPATFIQKIMNSTVMCLSPEPTGKIDNDEESINVLTCRLK